MRPQTFILALLLPAGFFFAGPAAADDARAVTSGPRTILLAVGKALPVDPERKQEVGRAAVTKIAEAAAAAQPEMLVKTFIDPVITRRQFRLGTVEEKVSRAVFCEQLKWLARTATPEDTVILYTHSHGRKAGFETSQPLGGIVLDPPVRGGPHGGAVLWDEYAELILAIPAKNVLVLTMSCFSGGLVDYLNTPAIKARWEDRREKEGRNLIVLTSQNASLTSNPIAKAGQVINPFTFAVIGMFAGRADGVALSPSESTGPDGKLTAGEIIDYVLDTTRTVTSDQPRLENTALPQLTGSFDRGDVMPFGAAGPDD